MEEHINYYREYRQLSGCSEERRERCGRIAHFVETYNKNHVFEQERSIQYKMYRINEDINRMQVMKALLHEMTESHKQLLLHTRHFVHSDRLNNMDVNQVFLKMKRAQHTKLDQMVVFVDEREREMACIQEHIEEFKLAYDAKKKTLVHLRKSASADLVAMFDRYLLMASSFALLRNQRQVLAHLFGCVYLELIFNDVVLINDHLVSVALATLVSRVQ